MITYPAMLDVPRELVTFLAALLATERRDHGTRAGTRALSCGKQSLFALVWFRERRDVALTGKGLGISQATSYRYLDEVIDVLAARAPDLHQALQRAQDDGWSHLILDGKVIDTDRLGVKTLSKKGKTIDAWYSGKTHDFGGNIQALMPRRVPGLDLTGRARLGTRPDRGPHPRPRRAGRRRLPRTAHPRRPRLRRRRDRGTPPVKQPADGSELDINTRTRNMLLRSLRCLGERGFALLARRWRTLQHVTVSPSKISKIARAALVLTHFEHGYLTC